MITLNKWYKSKYNDEDICMPYEIKGQLVGLSLPNGSSRSAVLSAFKKEYEPMSFKYNDNDPKCSKCGEPFDQVLDVHCHNCGNWQ